MPWSGAPLLVRYGEQVEERADLEPFLGGVAELAVVPDRVPNLKGSPALAELTKEPADRGWVTHPLDLRQGRIIAGRCTAARTSLCFGPAAGEYWDLDPEPQIAG